MTSICSASGCASSSCEQRRRASYVGDDAAACSPPPSALSFSACGWLKLYNFGVAKALMEARMHERCEILGASAGSLVACGMALGLDFAQVAEAALDGVDRTHGQYAAAFRLRALVSETLDFFFQEYDAIHAGERDAIPAHERLAGSISVSVTTLPFFRKKRYTSFRSQAHLKQVLLASCCMSPLAGLPFKLDGEWVMDGGIADYQPRSHDVSSTVTISPFFCSSADIRPSRYVPIWWAFYPPKRADFEWIFGLGYDDACSWLQRERHRVAALAPRRSGGLGGMRSSPSVQSLAEARERAVGSDLRRSQGGSDRASLGNGDRPMADLARFPSDTDSSSEVRQSDPGDALFPPSGKKADVPRRSHSSSHSRAVPLGVSGDACVQPTARYLDKWPYATTRRTSFARVWGYRSVLRIVPSTLIDGLLLLLLVVLFRPLAWILVFAELTIRAAYLAFWAIISAPLVTLIAWLEDPGGIALFPALRRLLGRSVASRRRLRRTLRCVVSPTLLCRAIPIIGIWLSGKAYALRRRVSTLSFIFRICVHFL